MGILGKNNTGNKKKKGLKALTIILAMAIVMLMMPGMVFADTTAVATVTKDGVALGSGYTTIQAAVDAVQADTPTQETEYKIVIAGGTYSEEIGILQQANKDILFTSAENEIVTFTNVIFLDGGGRYSEKETLKIKGIIFDFKGKDASSYCIDTTNTILKTDHYSYIHNVTVEDCKFIGNNKLSSIEIAAFGLRSGKPGQGKNVSMVNCIATNIHSLLQCVGGTSGKITIKDCTADTKNGINLSGTGQTVEITGSIFDLDGYAVRSGASGTSGAPDDNSSLSITDSKISSNNSEGIFPLRNTPAKSIEINNCELINKNQSIPFFKNTVLASSSLFDINITGNYWGKDGYKINSVIDSTSNLSESIFTIDNYKTKLTLNANGGTFGAGKTTSEAIGTVSTSTSTTAVTFPTAPTQSGKSFKGWYTATTDGVKVNATDNADLTVDATLYAHWEAAGGTPVPVVVEPDVKDGEDLDKDKATIVDAINSAAKEDEPVIIDLPQNVNNVIVPTDIIQAAKDNSDKGGSHTLVIQTHETSSPGSIAASFTLDLTKINGTIEPFKTGISITETPSNVIKEEWPASEGVKTMAISLAHHGNFPAPVQITIPIDPAVASPNETVYLYYINKDTNKLELIGGKGIVVANDNTITFTLDHASDYVVSTAPAKATAITIDKSSVSLKMKKTTALKASLTPSEAIDKINWSSSNTKVAKVDKNGKVTAIRPGSATITASVDNKIKDTCRVKVAQLAKPVLKVKSTGYKSIKATWSKVSLASKYQVYRATSKNGKYSRFKTTASISFTNNNLKTGKTYYYKVRSYVKVGNDVVYSNFTAPVKVKPIPKTPRLTVKTTKESAKAIWTKVDGATGYKVYRAKSKDGNFIKIRDASKDSTYNKSYNMISGKTYYYKMRAYTKVDGKIVYSKYTEIVKVKVK